MQIFVGFGKIKGNQADRPREGLLESMDATEKEIKAQD